MKKTRQLIYFYDSEKISCIWTLRLWAFLEKKSTASWRDFDEGPACPLVAGKQADIIAYYREVVSEAYPGRIYRCGCQWTITVAERTNLPSSYLRVASNKIVDWKESI
jgi:hypothetical protein